MDANTGVAAVRYMAWDRGYYESSARMFCHDHERHGPFFAAGEAELITQLRAAGIDPESVRWEATEARP